VVNGASEESRMRVGCGSATIGIFAKQWHGKVDEVVVVDDHITGVLSEHQAGKLLGIPGTGIKLKGRRSTPGRYFQRRRSPAPAGAGTNITDPLTILGPFDPKKAPIPGLHPADGLHHRRARTPTTSSTRTLTPVETQLPSSRWTQPVEAHPPRTASRRSRPSCSSAAPAARCAPASPRTPSA
jgi:hypothetical protein